MAHKDFIKILNDNCIIFSEEYYGKWLIVEFSKQVHIHTKELPDYLMLKNKYNINFELNKIEFLPDNLVIECDALNLSYNHISKIPDNVIFKIEFLKINFNHNIAENNKIKELEIPYKFLKYTNLEYVYYKNVFFNTTFIRYYKNKFGIEAVLRTNIRNKYLTKYITPHFLYEYLLYDKKNKKDNKIYDFYFIKHKTKIKLPKSYLSIGSWI